MFPVLWEMNQGVRTAIAGAVAGIQDTHGNFAKEYAEEGLNYLMRQDTRQYEKFLHYFTKTLVDTIIAAAAPIIISKFGSSCRRNQKPKSKAPTMYESSNGNDRISNWRKANLRSFIGEGENIEH